MPEERDKQDKPLSYTQNDRTMREPEFPELTRIQANDRQQHIQRCLEMGMSREEAERHADSHMGMRGDIDSRK